MTRPNVNWHSAMVSGLKIELSDYKDILTFTPEYTLNTGPRRIDCLIEKKRGSPQIDLPIGSKFRQYNLIDYKSPYESMTVVNFYKVLSYAFSLPEFLNDVSVIDQLSVLLITHKYPKKLIKHLSVKLGKPVQKSCPGLYDIPIDTFPVSIVVLKELSADEYLWLRCLTDQLDANLPIRRLAQAYADHKEEEEYKKYMDQFIHANFFTEKGENVMWCEALYELFADELLKREQVGEARGEARGEQSFASLILRLIADNRGAEIERAAADETYRKNLLRQYQLI